MTASKYFNSTLIDKIMTHHSENYRTYLMPWGAIDIDCKGPFNLSKTNIERIKKGYNCELDSIENSNCECCGCGGDCEDETYTSIRFEKKDVKFRTVRFECQHEFDFDICYKIEREEYCPHCEKFTKIDYKSVLNDMQSLDKSIKEASK